MRRETSGWSWWARSLVLVGIVAAGLIGIVGSGGGGECGFLSDGCIVLGPTANAFLSPLRATVPVGGTVTFTVTTTAPNASFQWKRSRDGGVTYVAIAGATDASLTIAGAQLPDDGTLLVAEVSIPGTLVFGPFPARLYVSSMPGVAFADGEFQATDWSVATALAVPAVNGPTFSDERVATGGNPAAFRSMAYAFPMGMSSLRVFYASQAAAYDPAVLGAIHTIDFAEDCIVTDAAGSIGQVTSTPWIEQAGRRYAPGSQAYCRGPSWAPAAWPSLSATDLIQVDGPACGTGESCPDFSAAGTPLQFGYVRQASQAATAPAAAIVHGIDNWKVTVWRH